MGENKSMKNKIIVVSIFLALLITTVSTSGLKIQNNYQNENLNVNMNDDDDADLPIWNVGDSWTYECVINGGLEGFINLNNLKFSNMEFTVNEVQNDFYKMDMSADISGSVTVDIGVKISGSLRSTTIEGDVYVNKSSLSVEKVENLVMSGYIKPGIGPQIGFDVNGFATITYGKTLLEFPINRGDVWLVEDISVNVNASVEVGSLLSEQLDITIFIQEHSMKCEKWDNLDVEAGNFDALKLIQTDPYRLTEETHNVWFSPAAGNIVKVKSRGVPFSWGGWGYYDLDMELVSTTYEATSNIPNVPDKPSGPEVLDVGTKGTFESSATDPDGDILKLIFDWGDGEKTHSDFVQSGEQVTVNYTWTKTQDDPFIVKVKARDKYGKESSWSEELAVSVVNDAPEKPSTPDGPTAGRGGFFGKTYTYTTSTTDLNSHKIRYGWDWDGDKVVDQWTKLYESGETASASHKWTTKGTYDIRVKAKDEYNLESEWSDPLSVSMPKSKVSESSILQRLIEIFPNLELIFERIVNIIQDLE